MSTQSIERLTESVRQQVANKQLGDGWQWAYDIVAKHAAGQYRGGKHALKEAQSVVDRREALKKLKAGELPSLGPGLTERQAQTILDGGPRHGA